MATDKALCKLYTHLFVTGHLDEMDEVGKLGTRDLAQYVNPALVSERECEVFWRAMCMVPDHREFHCTHKTWCNDQMKATILKMTARDTEEIARVCAMTYIDDAIAWNIGKFASDAEVLGVAARTGNPRTLEHILGGALKARRYDICGPLISARMAIDRGICVADVRVEGEYTGARRIGNLIAKSGRIDLFDMIVPHLSEWFMDLEYNAARSGNREMCERVRAFSRAPLQIGRMFEGAIDGESVETYNLARKWYLDACWKEDQIITRDAVTQTARKDLKWWVDLPDMMLRRAAARGSRKMCEFMREQGARDLEGMLLEAIPWGRYWIIAIARKWSREMHIEFYARELERIKKDGLCACNFVIDSWISDLLKR